MEPAWCGWFAARIHTTTSLYQPHSSRSMQLSMPILNQFKVAREGLEPSTFALLARRSNRLSYPAGASVGIPTLQILRPLLLQRSHNDSCTNVLGKKGRQQERSMLQHLLIQYSAFTPDYSHLLWVECLQAFRMNTPQSVWEQSNGRSHHSIADKEKGLVRASWNNDIWTMPHWRSWSVNNCAVLSYADLLTLHLLHVQFSDIPCKMDALISKALGEIWTLDPWFTRPVL